MGDINQLRFVQRFSKELPGPYLEIGSKDYGTTQDLRPLFSNRRDYLGVDMEQGPGVDVVADMSWDFQKLDALLEGRRFGTVFCLSVLEHCKQPFALAQNLTRLLAPEGRVCISAPFAWKIHAYPDDYWRFTPQGIKQLFPHITFDPEYCMAASSRDNDFYPLSDDLGRIHFSLNRQRKQGHLLSGISAEILKRLSAIGLIPCLSGYRYLFSPTSILLLGTLSTQVSPESLQQVSLE